MTNTFRWLVGWLSLWLPRPVLAQLWSTPAPSLTITGSKTYELTTVILALPPYGQQDPFEVAQHSRYYQPVRPHFAPYAQHSLLTRVNYSRQEWNKYLSFRTDAYAFAFDRQGQLRRQFPFATQPSHHPFDEQLALVADFARVSGFRVFYQRHQPDYDSLPLAYQASQRLPQVLAFVAPALGQAHPNTQYAIVLSPLGGMWTILK